MKKIWKKVLGVALIVSMIGLAVGCKPATGGSSSGNGTDTSGTDTENPADSQPAGPADPADSQPAAPVTPTEYTLTVDKESVAVYLGKTAEITLTTNGTVTLEVESKTVATASVADGKITITPVAAGSTTLVITLNEDTDKEIEIPVVVKKSTMVLTMTMGEGLAIPGGSVKVLYGNGADKDASAYAKYVEVEATVAADGKSATAELNIAKANEWGWFNGIKYTVKDSAGNEVSITCDDNFEFAADGKEITMKAKQAETMTVKLEFQDFTATEAKVTYGFDDTKETVDAVVAADGSSATFTVSNKYINGSSYTAILSVVAKNGEDTLNIEFKGENNWFEFNKEKTDQVMPYALKSDWTEISNAVIGSVDASAFAGKTITKLKIEATNCDWSAVSGDWWIWTTPGNLVWVSNSYYKLEVTDAETIASIVENGLSVSNSEGLSATLVVSYN